MTLAEFRFLYSHFSLSAHVMECRNLYWPEWVDMARQTLRVEGRPPHIVGGTRHTNEPY